jgi:transcriptional regulator with XRE-family HTH domain
VAAPRSPRHRAFGDALRELRTERDLSQEALAAAAELDRTYVSGIERGERNPSLVNLLKLADALGVRLSELVLRAEKREKRQRR